MLPAMAVSKVAIVLRSLRMGGVESSALALARSMQRHGLLADVLEVTSAGEWRGEARRQGVRVRCLSRSPLTPQHRYLSRLAMVLGQYDVVLLHDAPAAMDALCGVRRSTMAIPVLHLPIEDMLMTATRNASDWQRLVVVAPHLVRFVNTTRPDLAGRVVLIPNTVEDSILGVRPERLSAHGGATSLSVAYAGRISQYQKRVMLLPSVLARAKARGVRLHFTCVGDGPDAKRLRAELTRLGLVHTWLGIQGHRETVKVLAGADILLLPSEFEGLPMVLLEAMAVGCVPIVTRLEGGADFVITDRVDGFLVEGANAESYAQILIELGNDRALLARISNAARRTIQSRFTHSVALRSYQELFDAAAVASQVRPPRRSGFRPDLCRTPVKAGLEMMASAARVRSLGISLLKSMRRTERRRVRQ